MAYSATAPLFRSGKKGALVFSPSDATHAAVNIATDDSTPGVNTNSGYPGYTRASGSFLTDLFAVGDYVRVTGAAAAVNGSTAAPKVWRIAYLTALTMGVEGTGSSAITTVTTAAGITIRKVRLFRPADLRSIAGAAIPITLQASTVTNLAGTVLQGCLDDGVTWTALPNVILPDTNNGSSLVVQFFAGYEVLLMIVPGASYAGTIYAG